MAMHKFKNILPPAKLEAIKSAVQEVFGTSDVDSCELLKGGLSNTLVYLIVVQQKKYVLRVVTKVDNFEDVRREHICTRLASEAGIAPYLHYYSDHAVTISSCIIPMR
jgi:hypothetical protein